jgi:hypothetical protein
MIEKMAKEIAAIQQKLLKDKTQNREQFGSLKSSLELFSFSTKEIIQNKNS